MESREFKKDNGRWMLRLFLTTMREHKRLALTIYMAILKDRKVRGEKAMEAGQEAFKVYGRIQEECRKKEKEIDDEENVLYIEACRIFNKG